MHFWAKQRLRAKCLFAGLLLLTAITYTIGTPIAVASSCPKLSQSAFIHEFDSTVESFSPQPALYEQRRSLIESFVEPNSMIGRNPELREILDRIEFSVLGREYLDGTQVHPSELLDLTVSLRQKLSNYAQRASQRYKDIDPEVSLLLNQVSNKLAVSDREINQFRMKIAASQDARSTGFAIQKTLLSSAVGFLGEVQVSVRVQDIQAVGRYVRKGTPTQLESLRKRRPELSEREIQEMAAAETKARLQQVVSRKYPELSRDSAEALVNKLMDKEIDLIWRTPEGKEAWGEIKNYKYVLSDKDVTNDYGGSRKTIAAQVTEFQILTEALSTQESPIELHHFPLNGVTEAGASVLRSEGANVHFVVK